MKTRSGSCWNGAEHGIDFEDEREARAVPAELSSSAISGQMMNNGNDTCS